MDRLAHRHQDDSVKAATDLLADRWVFLILREAFFGVRRFGEFQRNLNIARTILASRLKLLVAEGLLERRRYRTDPDWYEYRFTPKGLDFYPVALALMYWGDRYLAGDAGPPIVLRHHICGQLADPKWICAHCNAQLDPHDITPEPEPAWSGSEARPNT